MKAQILLFFFSLLSSFSLAQYNDDYNYRHHPHEIPIFSWGDQVYEKNLNGIGFLMKDLKIQDPNLHDQLYGQYAKLVAQNQNAKIIGYGGSVAGGALIIAGALTSSTRQPDLTSGSFNNPQRGPKINWGLIAGGLVVSSASAIIYTKRIVKHEDILNFTNQFNRYSEGEKIEFSIRPMLEIGEQSAGGLSFQIRF